MTDRASTVAVGCPCTLRHCDALTPYVNDGRIPIDNGLVERVFRRVATVRKKALFVGSHHEGRRAALLLSILTTCELLGLNPEGYLARVLPQLARGIRLAQDSRP